MKWPPGIRMNNSNGFNSSSASGHNNSSYKQLFLFPELHRQVWGVHIQLPFFYHALGLFFHLRTFMYFLLRVALARCFQGAAHPLPPCQSQHRSWRHTNPCPFCSWLNKCTPTCLFITCSAWVKFAARGKPLLRFVVKKSRRLHYCYIFLMHCFGIIQGKFVKSGLSIMVTWTNH